MYTDDVIYLTDANGLVLNWANHQHQVNFFIYRRPPTYRDPTPSVCYELHGRLDTQSAIFRLAEISAYNQRMLGREDAAQQLVRDFTHAMVQHFPDMVELLTQQAPWLKDAELWHNFAQRIITGYLPYFRPPTIGRVDVRPDTITNYRPDYYFYEHGMTEWALTQLASAFRQQWPRPDQNWVGINNNRIFRAVPEVEPRLPVEEMEAWRKKKAEDDRVTAVALALFQETFPGLDYNKSIGVKSRSDLNLTYIIPPKFPERVYVYYPTSALPGTKPAYLGYLCIVFPGQEPVGDKYVALLLRLRDDEQAVWAETYQHLYTPPEFIYKPDLANSTTVHMRELIVRFGGRQYPNGGVTTFLPPKEYEPNCIPPESWLY